MDGTALRLKLPKRALYGALLLTLLCGNCGSSLSNSGSPAEPRFINPPSKAVPGQMCGYLSLLASFQMIGLDVDPVRLWDEVGMSHEGISMLEMKRLVMLVGASANGVQATPEYLSRKGGPQILWIKGGCKVIYPENYFLVYMGQTDQGGYVLLDPQRGVTVVDRPTLAAMWTGECITICAERRPKTTPKPG